MALVDQQRWMRVREVFEASLDRPAGERTAFLTEACGSDIELRGEIESLLKAHECSDLDGSPTFRCDQTALQAQPTDPPDGRVGPYRLLETIGEGGFGTVYMAEQREPVQRRVALKIIKPGMDTRQVIARFEAERQALAMMDHPNIAKVHDAGATEAGRPYFVMELVKGVPITAFCDDHKLAIRQRLELFIDVCHAVQHAHTKGVIHRDIKPTNVLVTTHDDKAVPKVIDFGIAKATDTSGRLTDQTLFTEFRQLIGTPEYMSPEQATFSGLDIDTRSDVYSLGVLLYELLTGVTPFDRKQLRESSLDEMRRIIREVEPPKPSTRASSLAAVSAPTEPRPQGRGRSSAGGAIDQAQAAAGSSAITFASVRQTDPKLLSRQLRGDLDWIVMKCLEKDRSRRYATASELTADIQRHLTHEPVAAGPPSTLYRLRKALRRYRIPVAAAASLVLLILVSTVISTVFWQRAEREAGQARTERENAERVAAFMEDMLEGVAPGAARGRDTTVLKELLDAAAARVRNGQYSSVPQTELRLRMSIGKVYWILDDYAAARDMLDRVEELVRSSRGAESHEMADAMNAVANVMCDDGRLTEALDKSLAAIRLCDRIGIGDEATRVIALTNVVVSLTELSRNNEALSWSETALATSRRTFKGDDDLTADALLNHALLLSRHAPAEALPLYEEALAMFERLYGTTRPHPHFVRCLTLLGECLASLGQTDEALPKYEAAVDVSRHLYKVPNRDTVQTLHILAEALRRRGRLPEAERYAREAVQTARAHPEWSMNEPRINGELFLAQVLFDAGRPDEAVASLRECVELVREQYPGHLLAQMCSLHILSWALLKRDGPRWAVEVERLMRESLTMYEELPPPEHAAYAWARANALRQLGAALTLQGRFSEAEPELLAAYEGLRSPDSGTPPPGRFDLDFKRDCMERIAILYERWHGAQPGAGYDRKAVHWRAALLPTIQSAQGEAR